LSSVGIDVSTASGSIEEAIYSTYSSGKFSGLLWQSASTTATLGWNDLSTGSGISITQGTTYYICWQCSSSTFGAYYNSGGTEYYTSITYGSFASTTASLVTDQFTVNMRITYISS
jgi:hypothetical protein